MVIREGLKQGIEDYLEIKYLYMGIQLVRFFDARKVAKQSCGRVAQARSQLRSSSRRGLAL
jgi:hypothetical protein